MITGSHNNRGSYTVEAAITVTVVLLILFVMIFSYMIMMQKVMLSQIAKQAAMQGAEVWNDSRRRISDGSCNTNEKADPLYYRFFNDAFMTAYTFEETLQQKDITAYGQSYKSDKPMALEEEKANKIRGLICTRLKKTMLKPQNTYMTIHYKNTLAERKLTVQLEQAIKLPFPFISSFFKEASQIHIKATGVAVVAEPAEMIRNTDTLLEYGKKITSQIDLNQIFNKIRPYIQP